MREFERGEGVARRSLERAMPSGRLEKTTRSSG